MSEGPYRAFNSERCAGVTATEGVDYLGMMRQLVDAPATTVIVPVFNGGSAVRDCLESLGQHVGDWRVIVIDDASTDVTTQAVIRQCVEKFGFELVVHEKNLGYTATANHGVSIAGADDVVLLNSDTVVGPLCVERLRWVAYSSPRVASVTPTSDNAGAMSLPVPGRANEWAPQLSSAEISRQLSRDMRVWAQCVPTAHGFCVYLLRRALNQVGYFDEELFPQGYGEENDWSLRADALGYKNYYAPHVFVRHVRSQSFGSRSEGLIRSGRQAVDARWPHYTSRVRAWVGGAELASISQQARGAQQKLSTLRAVLPRRLYIVHRSVGGTPQTNVDLMESLTEEQESLVLESTKGYNISLGQFRDGKIHSIDSWEPETAYLPQDDWDDRYAEYLISVLIEWNVETVHIRHLIHTPTSVVATVCETLSVPFIYSTHDFHPVCPTLTLLDEKMNYCGGVCTPGQTNCTLTGPAALAFEQPLKNGWIRDWQSRMAGVLNAAERVVATTPSAAKTLLAAYPNVADKLDIIEHGRDLSGFELIRQRRADRLPGPLRVLAPAVWGPHKGTALLRQIAGLVGANVEWHVLGTAGESMVDFAVVHGEYLRLDLPAIARELDPDLVGIFSIWPETYAHTVSEAWAMGVPVIATDLGAPADRIRHHGGGITFPHDDPEQAAQTILELASAPSTISSATGAAPVDAVRSLRSMGNDYNRLYVRSKRRHDSVSVGVLDKAVGVAPPASADVRAYRRIRYGFASPFAHYERLDVRDYASGACRDVDVLLVIRDAIPDHLASPVLERVKKSETRLVVEMDDDLVTASAVERLLGQGYDRERLEAFRSVLGQADRVIVSTSALAAAVSSLDGPECDVVEIRNELDPRVWLSSVTPTTGPKLQKSTESRLLYMGSKTHGEDLALLDGLPAALSDRLAQRVVLEIVGVSSVDLPEGARRLVPSSAEYPAFVTWLRQNRGRWDGAVAPLAATTFNLAKSDLKLLEYGAMELRTVASPVGPYASPPPELATTADTIAEWVDRLEEVIVERREHGPATLSRDWVVANRMLTPDSVSLWHQTVLG